MSKKNAKKKSEALVGEVGSPKKIAERHMHRGIVLVGKNDGQKAAIKTINTHDVSVIYGVPGSGKSMIAMSIGLMGLLSGKYERLVLTRPYLEAGEKMGFLPGDFNHKIAPFMMPLMEIAQEQIGKDMITSLIDSGNIQILPLAYMRGVTLKNAFVVADEMQNATTQQMRMIFTRLGDNSKLVVTGDTEQSDLYFREKDTKNGLADCITRLKDVEEIGFFEMLEEHCVRSPIVAKIDKLYKNK